MCPQKNTKISNTRKSQNLSLPDDRKSISLMSINLDVLLESEELKGTLNIKFYK